MQLLGIVVGEGEEGGGSKNRNNMSNREHNMEVVFQRYIIKRNPDANLLMGTLTYEIRAVNNIPLVCLKSDIFAPSSRRMSTAHHIMYVAHGAAAAAGQDAPRPGATTALGSVRAPCAAPAVDLLRRNTDNEQSMQVQPPTFQDDSTKTLTA